MRVPRVFIDDTLSIQQSYTLDKNASSYLVKVLRLGAGNAIILFNNQVYQNSIGYFTAKLVTTGKQAEVFIEDFIIDNTESKLNLILCQGISKGDHMDTSIQKAVELGASAIIPVICERTVVNLKNDRLDKKMLHWQKIIISASEQSGRNKLLTLQPAIKFSELALAHDTTGYILSPDASGGFPTANSTNSISLLIGPEGGFTTAEMKLAQEKNFQAIRFGPRVLRTETAAIAAMSIIQSRFGDLN